MASGGSAPSQLGSWWHTLTALLSLQLGWGLWLMPADYARIGWSGHVLLVTLAILTCYSGSLYTRLYAAVPGAVLLADIGGAAAGRLGRTTVVTVIFALDATRCVILHLAAAQALHAVFPPVAAPPLWQCGAVVLAAMGVLSQVRSLGEMAAVFTAGTAAQLVAVAIVVWEFVRAPDPAAETAWVAEDVGAPARLVALMNMVFAYGGQFAFVEILGGMASPRSFASAVAVCTAVMGVLYAGLGSVGYACRGRGVTEVAVFALPAGGRSMRVAAALILVQASAQYLINLHVFVHNVLVLLARGAAPPAPHVSPAGSIPTASSGPDSWQPRLLSRSTSSCGHQSAPTLGISLGPGPAISGLGARSQTDTGGRLLPMIGGQPSGSGRDCFLGGDGGSAAGQAQARVHASEHPAHLWLGASCVVLVSSFCVATSLPLFPALVSLVAAATYLVVAYALPAWFALALLPRHSPRHSPLSLIAWTPPDGVFSSTGSCGGKANCSASSPAGCEMTVSKAKGAAREGCEVVLGAAAWQQGAGLHPRMHSSHQDEEHVVVMVSARTGRRGTDTPPPISPPFRGGSVGSVMSDHRMSTGSVGSHHHSNGNRGCVVAAARPFHHRMSDDGEGKAEDEEGAGCGTLQHNGAGNGTAAHVWWGLWGAWEVHLLRALIPLSLLLSAAGLWASLDALARGMVHGGGNWGGAAEELSHHSVHVAAVGLDSNSSGDYLRLL